MRQRRRVERHFAARPTPESAVTSRVSERRIQRLLYWGGGCLVALVIVLVGLGWFFSAFQPPRKSVAQVDNQVFTLREVVPYTLMEGALSGRLQPGAALNNLIRDTVIARQAPSLGVVVSTGDLDAELAARFEPKPDQEAEAPSSITQAGVDELEQLVDQLGVSVDDYREWVRGQIWQTKTLDYFVGEVPETAEQLLVHWIVAANSVEAQIAYDRIAGGEDFAAVALETNTERLFSAPDGSVGWIPEGALPEIDPLIFSEDTAVDDLLGPFATSLGSMIIRVTEGPSERELDDLMRRLLAQTEFQGWMDLQTDDLAVNLTDEDIRWVLRKLGVS